MHKIYGLLKLKPHEILLFLSGVGILISLPYFHGFGLNIWLLAKALYLLGVLLFIFNVAKK